MRRVVHLAVSVAFFLAVCEPAFAFAPATQTPSPEFRTGTAVVLLDVIARDKAGRPVRDLRREELQVFENDQRCEVQSFRYVESRAVLEAAQLAPSGATAVPLETAAAPAARPASASEAPLNLVTLVFDRLLVEESRNAARAAHAFVARGIDARTQVAVFRIGSSLSVVLPFTSEREPLLAAIELATSGNDAHDRSLTRDALKAWREYQTALAGRSLPAALPATGDASQPTGERISAMGDKGDSCDGECKRREAVARALQMADSMQRQIEGQRSLYPLLALVKAQAALAGRKTLVYFSPGLTVPPDLDELFQTVISEANRSNVSLYAVDARGLQLTSDITDAGASIRQTALQSQIQQTKDASTATTVTEMQIMDRASDSLTLNLQQRLSDLAEATGGFLIANSNDFGPAVDRVIADLRGYYELTYVPAVVSFDGRFRSIRVAVARKDVALQSRKGYYALPPSEGIVLPQELALMRALSAARPAHDFAQRAAALQFGLGREGTETAVVMEVPLAALPFAVDQKAGAFALHLAVLALVKDASGQVLRRFGDEYRLEGALAQLEATKQKNAVVRRLVELPPGRYTLETAALVEESGGTSVERTSFEVPIPPAGPLVSTLSLVRRAEPLADDMPAWQDPFRIETSRVVPELSQAVSKSATPVLSFFARLYPAPGVDQPKLSLEVVRDGRVVGHSQPPMPTADDDGQLAYLGGIPSTRFEPGQYEVRLTLAQGASTATQSTRFELLP